MHVNIDWDRVWLSFVNFLLGLKRHFWLPGGLEYQTETTATREIVSAERFSVHIDRWAATRDTTAVC